MTKNKISTDAVFRFRSTQALIGEFQELETQAIYFAPPEELNDPMEGLREFHWKGDEILWRNLLRHYTICLHNKCIEYVVAGDDLDLSDVVTVFQDLENFPTPEARSLCEACLDAIEQHENSQLLVKIFSMKEREISQSELVTLLSFVQLEWVEVLLWAFREQGLITASTGDVFPKPLSNSFFREYLRILPALQDQHPDNTIEVLHAISGKTLKDIGLNQFLKTTETQGKNLRKLLFEFPEQYVKALSKLVYPNSYIASFSQNYTNPAMWSYYANGHNGCCLIFKPKMKDGRKCLSLRGPVGFGTKGTTYDQRDHHFECIRYENEASRQEFFTAIGQLSFRALEKYWFSGPNGEKSTCGQHLEDGHIEIWRKKFWDENAPPLLRKLPQWQHEEELRILLTSTLGLYDDRHERVLSYDFEQLGGIIFGTNVSMSDKAHMMEILRTKGVKQARQQPIGFFNAEFDRRSGKMRAL